MKVSIKINTTKRRVRFVNVQSFFAWKCRLFCLCAHVQCRVWYIYHVEFHFRFRHPLSFPVKHHFWSDNSNTTPYPTTSQETLDSDRNKPAMTMTMADVDSTLTRIHDVIQKSGLHFVITQTPWSSYITIRRKFTNSRHSVNSNLNINKGCDK